MNNPMQMIQMMMNMANSGNNTQSIDMLKNIMNNNQGEIQNSPNYQRAVEMMNGKSPQEKEQIIKNMCQNMGVDYNQALNMAKMMGLKL